MSEFFRIVHISDPHFGTTTPEKKKLLSNTIRTLDPDLVAISGDITQRARRKQFLEARQFCDSLSPLPLMAVPGNHDIPMYNIPARFLFPYFGFKQYLKFPLSEWKNFGPIEVLALDSTSPARAVQGQLRGNEIKNLHRFSKEAKFRVVMCHHPMDCPRGTDEKNILKFASRDMPLFEDAKVDLILGGHIHDPLARLSSKRYENAKRPMPIVLAGTCLSSRTRSDAPNSFNLIEICMNDQNIELDITRYDLTAQGTFVPLTETQFTRNGRDQWLTRVKNESLMSPHTSEIGDR
jgi:3',5'-cyclic AMP phosphodiesterase CpdA